jgi:hypothetical protein
VTFPPADASVVDCVQCYLDRHWYPIPIPYRTKKPVLEGWESLRLTPELVPLYFNGPPQNIGILVGDVSGHLVDVDLDAPEAVQLATIFLPPTPCRFGRPSKPESHHLYIVSPTAGRTAKYEAPSASNAEKTMLVEYRATGGQTVFPNSQHPDDEKSVGSLRSMSP